MQKAKPCDYVLLTTFLLLLSASAAIAAPHTFTIEEIGGSSSVPTAPQSLTASPGNALVTLTWTAPASGAPITNYRIYRGASPASETFLAEIGNVLTYTDSPLTNGQSYYYTVSAKNSIGEGPQSNEASATPQAAIDAPPTISITSPADGATVANTITVTAAASDDKSVTKVDFYIDGAYKSTDAAAPYTYLLDTTLYPNGNHIIKAMAFDIIQNTSTQITVNVDNYVNSPPVLSWTGEPNYITDGLTPESGDTGTQFAYRITYSDVDGDAPLLGYPKVHIRNSSGEITNSPFTMTAADSNSFITGRKYTVSTPLPAGSFSYYFETYDSANNRVQTSTINAPTVTQLTTPTVSFTSPINGATNRPFRNPVEITFSEPMSKAETELAITTSPVISGGVSWNPGSDKITITPSADMLVDTVYTVTVSTQAKSAAGVNMAEPYVFSFRTSPPMGITVITPKNNSVYNSVLANITTSSNALGCDAVLNGVNQFMNGSGTSWYLQLAAQEGQNTLKFECGDSVGNVWQTVATYYFTLDTVKPVLTTAPQTVSVPFAMVNVSSSEPLSTAIIEWEGSNYTMSGSGNSWSRTMPSLANGNHSYKIYANDIANNWNSANGWVYISVSSASYNRLVLNARDKSGTTTNVTIRIYNSTGDVASSSSLITKDLLTGSAYNIKYALPSGVTFTIADLVITKNTTLSPQFTDATVDTRSPIVAFNDTDIASTYTSAEIVLPITGAINRIMHCTAWNYATAACSSWQYNLTSEYNADINATHAIFNVTKFDAYAVGYYVPPASCSDGLQNQGETGVDCGGPCGACSSGTTSTSGGGGGGSGNENPPSDPTAVTYTTIAKITGYPSGVKISPGNTLDFDVTVKNTGNKPLKSLFIEFDNTWFTFDHKRISLTPDQAENIKIKLVVPAMAKPGQYPVTVYLKGDSIDRASFVLTVTEKGGAASVAMIDTETVRKTIEKLKQRIQLYSGQGYNLTAARDLVGKAEESFISGDYLQASDYTGLANDILERTIQKSVETKTFLLSYVLAGVIVVLLVLLYYFYRKYRAELMNASPIRERTVIKPDAKTAPPKNEAKTGVPAPQRQEMAPIQPTSVLDEEVNMDDMLRRLEEIKKRLNR